MLITNCSFGRSGFQLDFTARCYASAVLSMGPCLQSVCLCLPVSVTSRCSTKTAKHRTTQTNHTIAQGL